MRPMLSEGGVAKHGVDTARAEGSAVATLTPAEFRVLELMSAGYSNGMIAELLVVSPRTVEDHSRLIFQKFGLCAQRGCNRRVRAVLEYLRFREAVEAGGAARVG